jgi:O-acetyl-ADP-ribose deacetylase (regulator of RNase III)
MDDQLTINRTVVRLLRADVTDIEIEAFVYYARSDLALGAGFGGAIAVRGGPTIQEELKKIGTIAPTEAVITAAGEMKAGHIIHANGPKFQEENLDELLRATMRNVLKLADEKKIKRLAFPPMGTGFYVVPLDVSARVMFEIFDEYLQGDTGLEEIIICLLDSREYKPFQAQLASAVPH